jgi:amino acid transporter
VLARKHGALRQNDLDNRMDELSGPKPVLEIVLGTLMMIVVIFVHGAGIRTINQRFSKSWIHVNDTTPYWRLNLLLAITIGSLAALHFAETLLWAIPLSVTGLIPSMRDSYYYVLESYTTLGGGNINLPDRWRLVGPIIAMSGLFTFGWTGSVLVNVMTEFGKLDKVRAKGPTDRGPSDGADSEPRR